MVVTSQAKDTAEVPLHIPRGYFEREYVEQNECQKCDGPLTLQEYRTRDSYEAWAVCPACGWKTEL